MSIVTAGSLEVFFNDLVGESLRTKKVEASNGTSAYLVGLLSEFSRPERAHDETDADDAFLHPLVCDPAPEECRRVVRVPRLLTIDDLRDLEGRGIEFVNLSVGVVRRCR